MKLQTPGWFFGAALGLALCLCGCLPSSQGPADEQKEPYFLKGKAREGTLDMKGAIEAYEKALEANPQNASAHFELGLLSEKEADFSAAIYHFERYLKLRPESNRSQTVKDLISQDKMELSRTTIYAPMTRTLQAEFETLAEENKKLRAENEKLRATIAGQSGSGGVRPPDGNPPGPGLGSPGVPLPRPPQTPPPADSGTHATVRSYSVKAGDTPSSIARKFNVKLDALLALNPTLDPKRMKVGQPVKIPLP